MQAQNYLIDDGTSENGVGLTGGGDVIALNSFSVTGGLSLITSISIAWGTPLFPNATLNGTNYTVVLWSDPNGDGNPNDAVVLATAPGVIAAADTNTFITTAITPTAVLTPNFFVGFLITNANGQFPAAFDQTAPTFPNRSFLAGGNVGTGNINNLNANGIPVATIESLGLVGNWLIRANGVAVPEPSTYMLTGIGLLGLIGGRRFIRRQKA